MSRLIIILTDVSTDIHSEVSVNANYIDRYRVSVDILVDTQLIYQPSIDRYTVDTRPILGRVSVEISIDILTDT